MTRNRTASPPNLLLTAWIRDQGMHILFGMSRHEDPEVQDMATQLLVACAGNNPEAQAALAGSAVMHAALAAIAAATMDASPVAAAEASAVASEPGSAATDDSPAATATAWPVDRGAGLAVDASTPAAAIKPLSRAIRAVSVVCRGQMQLCASFLHHGGAIALLRAIGMARTTASEQPVTISNFVRRSALMLQQLLTDSARSATVDALFAAQPGWLALLVRQTEGAARAGDVALAEHLVPALRWATLHEVSRSWQHVPAGSSAGLLASMAALCPVLAEADVQDDLVAPFRSLVTQLAKSSQT